MKRIIPDSFATVCTGGGLFDVGLIAAGFRHLWGIEYEIGPARVASANGLEIILEDFLKVKPETLDRPERLHVSPPCPTFSIANKDRGETIQDLKLARHIAKFLRVLQPRIFTLENVAAYKRSKSLAIILKELKRLGYTYDVGMIDSSDYGVPQSRRRLWVRAVAKGLTLPPLPPKQPKVGWYAAIEDLLPDLPRSHLAQWQRERLPAHLKGEHGTVLVDGYMNTSRPPTVLEPAKPSMTIQKAHGHRPIQMPRAVLVDSRLGNYSQRITSREGDEPAHTVPATRRSGLRAVLVNTREMHGSTKLRKGQAPAPYTAVADDEPAYTVAASSQGHRHRAVLIHGTSTLEARDADQPSATVMASVHRKAAKPRVVTKTHTVSLTPRCLARFQSVPDSYWLPEGDDELACHVIGNGVPSRLAAILHLGLTAKPHSA